MSFKMGLLFVGLLFTCSRDPENHDQNQCQCCIGQKKVWTFCSSFISANYMKTQHFTPIGCLQPPHSSSTNQHKAFTRKRKTSQHRKTLFPFFLLNWMHCMLLVISAAILGIMSYYSTHYFQVTFYFIVKTQGASPQTSKTHYFQVTWTVETLNFARLLVISSYTSIRRWRVGVVGGQRSKSPTILYKYR